MGELIGSEEAPRIGLLNAVLPDETFTEDILRIAKNSPEEPSCCSRRFRFSYTRCGKEF